MLAALAMTRFALRVGDVWHADLMDEYLRRDYRFHARLGAPELFSRVIFSVNRVAAGMLDSALALAANLLIIVVIAVSVMFASPKVAAMALAWIGGGYLIAYTTARRRILRLGRREAQALAERTRIATEGLGAIKEVLLLGSQAHFRESFARTCRSITTVALRTQATAQSPRYALETATAIGLVGAALFVSRDHALGAWLAELTFLGFAAFRLLPALQQVFIALVRIRGNEALLEGIADDLARAVRRRAARTTTVGVGEAERLAPRVDVSLEEVTFAYREGAPVLRQVNVRISAGTVVGFTGPNGSGKTTLVDLLMGLLEPDAGCLRIDGIPIDAGNRARWQRSLAYVPQEPYLLGATLAENIAFGMHAGGVDRERLREAASRARLESLVARLPRGFDEPVGAGARPLSGGERQRVAIARALYQDAPVLVLDEATSALDGETAADILDLVCGLRGARTVVLIAHHEATLARCDSVFALAGGSIKPCGVPGSGRLSATRGAAHV